MYSCDSCSVAPSMLLLVSKITHLWGNSSKVVIWLADFEQLISTTLSMRQSLYGYGIGWDMDLWSYYLSFRESEGVTSSLD